MWIVCVNFSFRNSLFSFSGNAASHCSVNSSKDVTFEVLPNCASYIQLKLKRVTDGGDHDVAICEVVGTGVWDDEHDTVHWLTESESRDQTALDASSVLYTGLLRKDGII